MSNQDAYNFCANLNGLCRCAARDARPCESITDLLQDGQTPDDERQRIADEREAAFWDSLDALGRREGQR